MIGVVLAPILAIFGFLADNIFLGLISIVIAILGVRASVLNMNRTYTMIYFGVLFLTIALMVIGSSDSDDGEEKTKKIQTTPPRTTYKPTQTNKNQKAPQKTTQKPVFTQKVPVTKSAPHTTPVVKQKKVEPTETITTKKEAVTQAPVALDEPDTTVVFKPQRKPRVPRAFIAKQKAKARIAIQNAFVSMPCDTPSKFENFALSRGQTVRVKVCIDSDDIKIPFADRRRSRVQVRLVNVQGQRSSRRSRGRAESYLVITRLQLLFNKLILRPKNRIMRQGRIKYVVVDVSLH